MLAVRLEEELDKQLEQLARARRQSKSEIVRAALLRMLEDEEDIQLAKSARARMRSSKPLAQVRKELGLDR